MSHKSFAASHSFGPLALQQPVGWLDENQVVFVDDEVCVIKARPDAATLRVFNVKTQQVSEVGLARVRPLVVDTKSLDVEGPSPGDAQHASAIILNLLPYVNMRTVPMAVTQAIARLLGVSPRQTRRYMAALRRDPRSSSVVRGKRGRPKGLRLLDGRIERIIQHVITKHYGRREKVTKQEIVDRVVALCRRKDMSPPDSSTVLARIREAEGYALTVKREGSKRARQKWEARLGSIGELRPLQVVQIDHTRVDVMVVSPDRCKVLGRPWLSLAIDVSTRAALGFYVTMSPPSSVSVSMCLSHAILPKIEHGVDGVDYPMFGFMEEVRADNAKELTSPTLKTGCFEHGINIQWRPVGKAHYGGHIERLNGTLMQMVHSLPGTTFSSIAQRGDYPSEVKAILTLDEFRQWLTQQICFRYHTRVHRALGVPPLVAWKRYWAEQGEQGVFPRAPLNAAMFYVDFLPLTERVIHRSGVHFENRRYWHEELAKWMGRQITMRSDPRNLRCIWVTTPEGVRVEAHLVADDERLIAMDANERAYTEVLTARAFEDSDAIVAEAKRRTRRARRGADGGALSMTQEPLETDETPTLAWTDADIQIALQNPLNVEDGYV